MPGERIDPGDRLVGRERELQAVDAILSEVRDGGSAAVAVVGEPGIGKTRLVGELAARARPMGFRVLAGRGSELAPEVPFGLVVEAFDDSVAHLDAAVRRRIGDARLTELATVLPSLPPPVGSTGGALAVERFRCYHAVRALVEALSREQPVLLVFDDVHWADPASLELVSYLLRRGMRRTLLVLAYRRHAPTLLTAAVGRAVRDGRLGVLDLGPLTTEQMRDLLDGSHDPATSAALCVESGGNPFYLEQLARAARGNGAGWPPSGPPAGPLDLGVEVPGTVRTAIAQELARLSPAARHLALAAAVAGEPFDIGLAAEVAAVDLGVADALLDELIDAETVRPAADSGRFQFRHPIVRRAVYSEAGPGWRLQAHQRAASTLAARDAPLGHQAQHVLMAGAKVGDEVAITLLVEAGHDAVARTPASAAAWLAGAARLLPADAPTERHLSVLLPLANALAAAGRLPDGRAALARALEIVPASDGPSRRFVMGMIARLDQLLGRTEEAEAALVEALAQAEPGTTETATLTLNLARNLSMLGRWERAAAAATEAREMAAALGDRDLVHITTATSASLHSWGVVGDVSRAHGLVDEAAAGVDKLPDAELTPVLLEALVPLTFSEINLERWTQAESHAERGVRLCRATGEGFRYLTLVQLLALTRMLRGRLAEARRSSDAVFEATRLMGNDHTLLFAAAVRSWLLTLQGQVNAALLAGQEAVDAATRVPEAQYSWMAHVCCGLALLEAGQHEPARRRMLAAGGRELEDAPPASRTQWFRALAEVDVATGRLDQAEETAERTVSLASQLGLPMRVADGDYAQAVVQTAQERHEVAVASAHRAAEGYERSGVVLEAARARLVAARASVLAGDTETAVGDLRMALDVFHGRGAVLLADRTAGELRRLGARVDRKRHRSGHPEHGLDALSSREREVARLAAQGCTNRQIADELYVSRKTVETHLARVFAKLGVSSRAAVAAALQDPVGT